MKASKNIRDHSDQLLIVTAILAVIMLIVLLGCSVRKNEQQYRFIDLKLSAIHTYNRYNIRTQRWDSIYSADFTDADNVVYENFWIPDTVRYKIGRVYNLPVKL